MFIRNMMLVIAVVLLPAVGFAGGLRVPEELKESVADFELRAAGANSDPERSYYVRSTVNSCGGEKKRMLRDRDFADVVYIEEHPMNKFLKNLIKKDEKGEDIPTREKNLCEFITSHPPKEVAPEKKIDVDEIDDCMEARTAFYIDKSLSASERQRLGLRIPGLCR